MRITSKGQVTIPLPIRKKLGLLAHTEVEFEVDGGGVRIKKAKGKRSRGAAIVEALRGRATAGLSTDQIMALTRGAD